MNYHTIHCSMPEIGVCSCKVINPDLASEASAESHIQAIRLLRRAKKTIDDALGLLGEP